MDWASSSVHLDTVIFQYCKYSTIYSWLSLNPTYQLSIMGCKVLALSTFMNALVPLFTSNFTFDHLLPVEVTFIQYLRMINFSTDLPTYSYPRIWDCSTYRVSYSFRLSTTGGIPIANNWGHIEKITSEQKMELQPSWNFNSPAQQLLTLKSSNSRHTGKTSGTIVRNWTQVGGGDVSARIGGGGDVWAIIP